MEGRPRPAPRGRRAARPTAATASPSPSWPACRRRCSPAPSRCSAKLEEGRAATGGIAAGLDDLPLFAAAPHEEAAPDPVHAALGEVEPDTLSPREALELVYRLKRLPGGARTDGGALPLVANRREIIDRTRDRGAARRCGSAQGRLASSRPRSPRARRDRAPAGEKPYAGTETASAYAFLTDQVLRLVYDYVTGRLHPLANPTTSERLLLMAVGGYGRGEMAPHSDVDIAFVTPWKPTDWTETVIEAMLYLLWDLGLKVGHSTRTRRRDGARRRGRP